MKKLTTLALLLLLIVVSCKKNSEPEPDLPPETQSGANTFGCYLNGVPWKPSPRSPGNPTLYIQLDGPYFALYAYYEENGRDERIDFFSNRVNFDKVGNYSLKKNPNIINCCGFLNSKKNIEMYTRDSDVVEDGMLTITKFDTKKNFVSGRFWFSLQKGDIKYEAKDGRFDISF